MPILGIGLFLFFQQFRVLCLQLFDLGQLLDSHFIKGIFSSLVEQNFFLMFFPEFLRVEESREIIPLMESMIGQIEEQQTLMAEMLLEMQNRDTQLSLMQEQNQKLQKLNSELSELLNILPNTEELLSKMEEQKTKIELLENENQQWQKLAQKLNSENSLLLKQNTELLNWNSR